jgi:hypothetical protein
MLSVLKRSIVSVAVLLLLSFTNALKAGWQDKFEIDGNILQAVKRQRSDGRVTINLVAPADAEVRHIYVTCLDCECPQDNYDLAAGFNTGKATKDPIPNAKSATVDVCKIKSSIELDFAKIKNGVLYNFGFKILKL